MKVIIIGAGIGGLSTYHSLRKHLANSNNPSSPLTIKIFESHGSPTSTTSNIGGGLGLAPNGLRAIASVSPKAAEYIQAHGYPGAIMAFRNSTGRLLGQYWNGRKERYGFGTLMLRRSVVHEALLRDIPSDAIVWGMKVSLVRETEDGAVVEFSDGSTETGDLVIGADGVRSVVRKAIFDDRYPAEYDGLTGVGGFIPTSALSERFRESLRTEGVSMTFGPHGFFGYSICPNPGQEAATHEEIQWWSIYESANPPDRDAAHVDIRNQLLERHSLWKSPYDSPDSSIYQSIIELGCGTSNDPDKRNETLLILSRYVTPRIPQWCSPSGSGRVVLLGDAAHAMPPDSGQGVSCAAEDAVAIGLLLKHYCLDRELSLPESLRRTASAYEGVRMKRVWHILDIAKRSGDSKKKQSKFQERIRDSILWLICKLPESFLNDTLLAHDVNSAVAEYLSKIKSDEK
ncbi:hypothetical protein BDZ94DRAFT_1234333 [Collybia nuda]|uniref:FAD-binding domain-containing protein n=1 Tax=Collybia nuda TaxID=64659 RepID=A0A9P6CM90_9AGAR|nr:hypothetical protein BDZ94DRAFT_1234333 [Collybia nuda]